MYLLNSPGTGLSFGQNWIKYQYQIVDITDIIERCMQGLDILEGFVLTNCMNKFVCAQLEASGRTSSPVYTHAHAY